MRTEELEIASISISPLNTRKNLEAGTEDTNLEDLADSIREHGLLNPVIVMRVPAGGYELIAGQRRYYACRQLGMNTISAVIRDDLDPAGATVISLIENVHRADMSPLDKAQAYRDLYNRYETYSQVSKATGVSVSTIRRYLRLLELSPSLQHRLSTSDGAAGIGTLSKLAETFALHDQEYVYDQIAGFNQKTQGEILKRSGGNVESIEDLKRMAMEGEFDVRSCSEGLCFKMPGALKERIKGMLSQPDNLDNGVAI